MYAEILFDRGKNIPKYPKEPTLFKWSLEIGGYYILAIDLSSGREYALVGMDLDIVAIDVSGLHSCIYGANQHGTLSACQYPHYSDHRICGIHDSKLVEGWICDPDNIFSMSEVYIIDNKLREIYKNGESKCQCPLASFNASDNAKTKTRGKRKAPCWYKFGFAFLKELDPTARAVAEAQTNEHCSNHTVVTADHDFVLTNPETAFLYAQTMPA
uniref:Uncharacterized protein n=1 Tax=Ditylenchus dipsaci TaxID=166011 RepID=A0A915DWD5_9BILA